MISNADAHSSKTGQIIARTYLAKSCAPEEINKDNREILQEGFEAIEQSKDVTVEEKALARLGKDFKATIPKRYPSMMAMLSLMNQLIIFPATSGHIGSVLARACSNIERDMRPYFDTEGVSLAIFRTGFQSIADNPQTEQNQQAMARFGSKVAENNFNLKDIFTASGVVMESLMKPIPGPIGPAIAVVSRNAIRNVELPQDVNHVLDSGFEAINESGEAGPEEKTLAQLGRKITGKAENSIDVALSKAVLMDCIASVVTGPLGAAISDCAIDAVALIDDDFLAEDVLRLSFETIADSPLASDKDKALAQEGLAIKGGPSPEDTRVAVGKKFLVMRKISNQEEVEKTNDESSPDSIDFDDDNDIVAIGGLRLDRQSD